MAVSKQPSNNATMNVLKEMYTRMKNNIRVKEITERTDKNSKKTLLTCKNNKITINTGIWDIVLIKYSIYIQNISDFIFSCQN